MHSSSVEFRSAPPSQPSCRDRASWLGRPLCLSCSRLAFSSPSHAFEGQTFSIGLEQSPQYDIARLVETAERDIEIAQERPEDHPGSLPASVFVAVTL